MIRVYKICPKERQLSLYNLISTGQSCGPIITGLAIANWCS